LSRLICGNTLTQLLGDHGADVIKVESLQGDTLRSWRTEGIEAHWKNLARNKRSLSLDLREPRALEIIRRLVPEAQILVESFRPGTLEKMGLSTAELHLLNPGLVIVRISGWGQTGPYAPKPGFGSLVEGMSGFAAMSGYPDRAPLLPPCPIADAIAGHAGALAAMLALRHVEVSGGRGQVIDIPLFDPIFSILGPEAAIYKITGRIRQRTGSRSTNSAPRNVYPTKDRKWVALSASIQQMAIRVFDAIGHPELRDDPRFSTNPARVANADALDAIVGDFIRQKTQAENIAYFDRAEVTIGPIYDIAQVVDDAHFQERQAIVELPDRDIGRFPMTGIVPRLELTPGDFVRPAPLLGEHSREILYEIGFTDEQIDVLRAAGVVREPASDEQVGNDVAP
jgi:formyl-CoA transferase